jgi:ribosomal protein S18 acetylase RimI-like enzyme
VTRLGITRDALASGDARASRASREAIDAGELVRRPAVEQDRDFFWELRREALRGYAEPLFGWVDEEQQANADYDFDFQPFEILERGGRRVGYLCVIEREDHDFLDELALVAPARGHGHGAAVIRGVLAAARARGVPLRLSVLVNNPAKRLYDRLGFAVVSADAQRIRMEQA